MALGFIAGLAGRFAGKAARWATKRAFGSRATSAATGAAAGYQAGRRATGGRGTSRTRGFGPDLNPFGTNERTGDFFGFGGEPKRKYRRMNYLNQRALKKSIKRVQGFEKIVREAFTVSKGSLQLKRGRSCR